MEKYSSERLNISCGDLFSVFYNTAANRCTDSAFVQRIINL